MENRGFTLIELLVVISIIGLLASVVLSSLQSARLNAQRTSVKAEVAELIKVAQSHYFATGDYQTFVTPGWVASSNDCNNHFLTGSNYSNNARSICQSLVSKITPISQSGNDYYMFVGANISKLVAGNDCTAKDCFAINARVSADSGTVLTDSTTWYCRSDQGNIADDHTFSHNAAGCERNP